MCIYNICSLLTLFRTRVHRKQESSFRPFHELHSLWMTAGRWSALLFFHHCSSLKSFLDSEKELHSPSNLPDPKSMVPRPPPTRPSSNPLL